METKMVSENFYASSTKISVAANCPAAEKRRKGQPKFLIEDMRNRFAALRSELGDYDLKFFDHVEKRFFDLLSGDTKKFIRCCIEWSLKNGTCPARDWLKVNHYPITITEVMLLTASRLLTEESGEQFFILIHRFLFKYKNSSFFRALCKRQDEAGFSSVAIWMEKHNFKPVYKKLSSQS